MAYCPIQHSGEKDLTWGFVRIMKKTDTFNRQAGESGGLLSMAGRQNGSFQPVLLLAEVTADH